MIEAREIDFHTLSAIFKLNVRADQKYLVAPNSVTIAQCHYEPAGWLRGLWSGDTPVGLIAMINPLNESPSFEEGDRLDAAYIWRLMIAEEHQAKGYGAEAIAIAVKQARAWGLPNIYLSVVPEEGSAIEFYEAQGFAKTGIMHDQEVEMLRPLLD